MKIALLSDIHGNSHALHAVINAAQSAGVSQYLIAGDFMGGYYRLNEVIEILKTIEFQAIRGNHEDMYSTWKNDPQTHEKIISKYGSSFTMYDNLDINGFLNLPEQLETTIDNKTILMCHGTLWDHNEYCYPDSPFEKQNKLFEYNKDIIIFGHTHYPVIWKKDSQIIVNPGSVGQPRDYIPGACWALWDTQNNQIDLMRENYDASPVIDDCIKYDPNLKYSQNVLLREKQT